MAEVNVGIVIVNYNGTAHTINLFESLVQLSDVEGCHLSVVVIDNGSNDDELITLQESIVALNATQINVQLIVQGNLGFASGVNRGLTELINEGVDWYWILNNDTELDRYCLRELLLAAGLKKKPTLYGASLIYLDDHRTIQAAGGAKFYRAFARGKHLLKGQRIDQCYKARVGKIDYIAGASIFLSR